LPGVYSFPADFGNPWTKSLARSSNTPCNYDIKSHIERELASKIEEIIDWKAVTPVCFDP
jgi:hypothetical protein